MFWPEVSASTQNSGGECQRLQSKVLETSTRSASFWEVANPCRLNELFFLLKEKTQQIVYLGLPVDKGLKVLFFFSKSDDVCLTRLTSCVSRARVCFSASYGDRRRPTPQPSHNTYTAGFSDPATSVRRFCWAPATSVQQRFRISFSRLSPLTHYQGGQHTVTGLGRVRRSAVPDQHSPGDASCGCGFCRTGVSEFCWRCWLALMCPVTDPQNQFNERRVW